MLRLHLIETSRLEGVEFDPYGFSSTDELPLRAELSHSKDSRETSSNSFDCTWRGRGDLASSTGAITWWNCSTLWCGWRGTKDVSCSFMKRLSLSSEEHELLEESSFCSLSFEFEKRNGNEKSCIVMWLVARRVCLYATYLFMYECRVPNWLVVRVVWCRLILVAVMFGKPTKTGLL